MKAFKSELDPNNIQITALRKHCGAARWAYNWGINKIKAAADAGEKWPSGIDLHRQINAIKGTEELPWAYEVSKCAFQEPLRNLDTALKNMRKSRKGERKGTKIGFPKYKSRKKGLGSCRFSGTIKVFSGGIQLPRIGIVRLKECGYIPQGRYAQATISERAGHWFVSVIGQEPEKDQPTLTGEVVGVDVGIKTLATCSNGGTYANVRALAATTKQLCRAQRVLSRRVKGSKNRAKARMRVAKLHKKIADIRVDAQNKAARDIVNQCPSVIVLEDLNINGMFKNRKLSRALSDAAIGQFGRILTYMAEDAGIVVAKVGRFFASSKLCSDCGWKNDNLTLGNRRFVCHECGLAIDRDLNAAINLKNTVSSTGINDCGDCVRPMITSATVAEAVTLS